MVRILATPRDTWKRWAVLALAALAVTLDVVAFHQPVWGFYLYAPQYPEGLLLSIHLNGVVGDVAEINTLNHYIGMAHLDEAAKTERALSGFGVFGIALATMLLAIIPGRRYARFFTWPALAFPVVFVGLTYYWMYNFGHHLSVEAPVRIAPFTPVLLGHGTIGNFHTTGMPGAGFYCMLAASLAVGAAFFLRRSVCSHCPRAAACGLVCHQLFLGPRSER